MADPRPLTDGERWSRDLLAGLRAEGYRPGAWLDFLARSFERAASARGERRALARQARRWGIAGAGASVIAAHAARLPPRRCLAWWGLCWAMLEWHLGMVEGSRGEPRAALSAADALTLARLGLVPFAAAPTGRGSWGAAVALAAASDAADGRLARRAGATRLGRELDSSADAAFFSAAALGAARAGWIARPVALASLGRHVGGVGFVACHWFAHGSPPPLAERSTRWATAPSAAGLLLAAAGARRTAGALLFAGSAAAAAVQAAALAETSASRRHARNDALSRRLESAALGRRPR